jgi:hypothetical protein
MQIKKRGEGVCSPYTNSMMKTGGSVRGLVGDFRPWSGYSCEFVPHYYHNAVLGHYARFEHCDPPRPEQTYRQSSLFETCPNLGRGVFAWLLRTNVINLADRRVNLSNPGSSNKAEFLATSVFGFFWFGLA